LTKDDVCLITNDWEDEWKILGEQTKHSNEEEELDNDKEALDEGHGNGKHNGTRNMSNNQSRKKVRRGGPNELGHISSESIFDRLHRG